MRFQEKTLLFFFSGRHSVLYLSVAAMVKVRWYGFRSFEMSAYSLYVFFPFAGKL